MELGLNGRKVLVTGASQGIGEGLAQSFAAEGCELFLVARSAERLDRIAAGLRARHGVEAHVLAEDMTAPSAIARVAEFAGEADIACASPKPARHSTRERRRCLRR